MSAFDLAKFCEPERVPLSSLRAGWIVELPNRLPCLLMGPVSVDQYRSPGDHEPRIVVFANRLTRDGRLGSLTLRARPGASMTVRKPRTES